MKNYPYLTNQFTKFKVNYRYDDTERGEKG